MSIRKIETKISINQNGAGRKINFITTSTLGEKTTTSRETYDLTPSLVLAIQKAVEEYHNRPVVVPQVTLPEDIDYETYFQNRRDEIIVPSNESKLTKKPLPKDLYSESYWTGEQIFNENIANLNDISMEKVYENASKEFLERKDEIIKEIEEVSRLSLNDYDQEIVNRLKGLYKPETPQKGEQLDEIIEELDLDNQPEFEGLSEKNTYPIPGPDEIAVYAIPLEDGTFRLEIRSYEEILKEFLRKYPSKEINKCFREGKPFPEFYQEDCEYLEAASKAKRFVVKKENINR